MKNTINNYINQIDGIHPLDGLFSNYIKTNANSLNPTLEIENNEKAYYFEGNLVKIVVSDIVINNFMRELEYYYKEGKVLFIASKQVSLVNEDAKVLNQEFYFYEGILISDIEKEDYKYEENLLAGAKQSYINENKHNN